MNTKQTLRVVVLLMMVAPGVLQLNAQEITVTSNAEQRHRPPDRYSAYREMGREYLEIRRDAQQLESEIERGRADYYQQTQGKLKEIKEGINEMIWDVFKGKSPNRTPDLRALVKIARDYGKYVGNTAGNLISLEARTNELELRVQKVDKMVAELKHKEALADRRPPSTPKPPLTPVDPPTEEAKPTDFSELDDAIDIMGYQELGDRYFDGRPEAWKRFLDKHPEYKRDVRPELPPDEVEGGSGDAAESNADSDDAMSIDDDDAMDMLGFMMKGKEYFANRPGGWERFKERHPDYKDLTYSALEQRERIDSMRRLLKEYDERCAFETSLMTKDSPIPKVCKEKSKLSQELSGVLGK